MGLAVGVGVGNCTGFVVAVGTGLLVGADVADVHGVRVGNFGVEVGIAVLVAVCTCVDAGIGVDAEDDPSVDPREEELEESRVGVLGSFAVEDGTGVLLGGSPVAVGMDVPQGLEVEEHICVPAFGGSRLTTWPGDAIAGTEGRGVGVAPATKSAEGRLVLMGTITGIDE